MQSIERNGKISMNSNEIIKNQHRFDGMYTRDCFVSRMIHKALLTQDMESIFQMAFFIRDLYREIDKAT